MASDGAKPTIFLSYAHADREPALQLTSALQQRGYTVWWDALLEGGTRYAATIDEALQTADAVLVLWSKQSIDSDWVRDEAAQGRDRHRLVPLSLGGIMPPLGFRQIQMIDLTGWRGRADAPQIEAIERAIAAAIGQPLPPRRAAPRFTRRGAMAGGGVVAVAIAGGGALVGWRMGLFDGGSAEPRSIAVLPFKNFGGDPDQADLADGLTDEIRSALARNGGLMVLAGTSSNSVADMAGDAKAIARKLGVTYLLEGSVQRAGDRVAVATNLTNGSTGFSEWAQRVERPLGDIFAFEAEIARAVSNAMSVQMATDAPAPGGTRNVAAYEAYLRGRALYNLAKDEETDRRAKANYELAIASDPNFALAHAALSRVLASIASNEASANEIKPLYAAAISEARRATELAPTLADGHLALGYALFAGKLDIRGARPSYEAAYRYGRGDADIVLLYAAYSARTRRFEAARSAIERALALDPLNPRSWRAAGTVSTGGRGATAGAGAVRQGASAQPLDVQRSCTQGYGSDPARALGGRKGIAGSRAERDVSTDRSSGPRWKDGRPRARRTKLCAAWSRSSAMPLCTSRPKCLRNGGRNSESLDRLEKARVVGDSGLVALVTDPYLAPLRRSRAIARWCVRSDSREPGYRARVYS